MSGPVNGNNGSNGSNGGNGQAVSGAGPAANGAGERATPKRGPGPGRGDRPRTWPRRVHGRHVDGEITRLPRLQPAAAGHAGPAPAAGRHRPGARGGQRHAVGARAPAARRRHQPHLRRRHQQADPGRGQPGPDDRPAAPRGPRHGGRHAVGDARGPRPGRRLRARRPGAAAGPAGLPRLVGRHAHAGPGHRDGRAAGGLPAAGAGPGQAVPAAAELLRPAAARRDPQPGHQRHRQPGPVAAADAEPARHLAADHRGRADGHVPHLAAAGPDRAGHRARLESSPWRGSASARSRSSSSSGRQPAS